MRVEVRYMTGKKLVRMLLVDDDETILRFLESVITQDFQNIVQIKSTSDPETARQILETELVDILITEQGIAD
jgi:response regulator RpfG family c-di-GMP phosphodiesterase